MEIDLVRGSLKELFAWSNFQYERPVYHGSNILYKANYNKKDDIYQLHEGVITQLTNTPFGGFNPFVHDNIVWYNNYTTKGYTISRQPLDSVVRTITPPRLNKTLYARQNNVDPQLPDSTIGTYAIKNYNVTAHSFNFHSLTLSGSDFEAFDNLKPGIFWLSNDVLNTTQVKLGYEYDTDIRKSIYSAEITYQRYYPKITIAYRNRGLVNQAKDRTDGTLHTFDWREHYLDANIQLPFSIYRRNYTYSYGFNFGTSYIQRYNVSMAVTNFMMTRKFPLNYQVYINRNHTMSTMDLTPRW